MTLTVVNLLNTNWFPNAICYAVSTAEIWIARPWHGSVQDMRVSLQKRLNFMNLMLNDYKHPQSWLSLTKSFLFVRRGMLYNPYTTGFIHEFVHANRKRPFWIRWSTFDALSLSSQYLHTRKKNNGIQCEKKESKRLLFIIIKNEINIDIFECKNSHVWLD